MITAHPRQTTARALALLVLLATCACARLPGQDVADVRSHPTVAREMLRLARTSPADVVYDLGSGDGRIVVAAAHEFGARGVGVEIDPALVAESRRRAHFFGVEGRVTFSQGDLFAADLHHATVVTLYLSEDLNRRLRPKLEAELPPGARVVSQRFAIDGWPPAATREVFADGRAETLYLWVIPERP